MRKELLFFSLLTLSACGQHTEQTSDTSALVTPQQATEAFAIVKAIDYLPFTFIDDGCYARSLYMSLELAAKGIPSSAHYVIGVLQPTPRVNWSYHVAPMIQVNNSTQEPWILDPAFESEPLTRTQWLNENFAASSKSEVRLYDIALYTKIRIRAGSAYFEEDGRTDPYDTLKTKAFDAMTDSNGDIVGVKPRPINKSVLIPNFQEMPTFLSSDIHSACTVMYSYIFREELDGVTNPTTKVKKLLTSTSRLVKAVHGLKKLTRNGTTGSWGDAGEACTSAMAGYY